MMHEPFCPAIPVDSGKECQCELIRTIKADEADKRRIYAADQAQLVVQMVLITSSKTPLRP